MLLLWLVATVFGLLIVKALVKQSFEHKRTETIKSMASELGFEFKGNADMPITA